MTRISLFPDEMEKQFEDTYQSFLDNTGMANFTNARPEVQINEV